MTPTPARLVEYWLYRSTRMQEAYYTASRDFDRRHLWLGIPAIVFSATVGTTVFASLSKNTDLLIQVCAGALSISAAILTTLQTFLKYSELSEMTLSPSSVFLNAFIKRHFSTVPQTSFSQTASG